MEKQNFVKNSMERTDLIQDTIGNFGRWQLRISVLMALLKLPIAWFQLGIVFLAPPTNFWCKPPDKYQNMSTNEWIHFSKPDNRGNETKPSFGYCSMKSSHDTNTTIPCHFGYEYNRTVFQSSIITEWDLVCGREHLVDVSQLILMLGVLLGSIVFGVAADRFGRKMTLLASIFIQSICGVISAFAPSLWMFILFRFLLAVANGGTVITSFVMCMEVVGGVWRTIVPILYQIPYGFGNAAMAGVAYYFRNWRDFQLVLSCLSGLYGLYLWCVPESPRWLMAVGMKREALAILKRAAVTNKLNHDIMERTPIENFSAGIVKERPKISAVFSTNTLRKRTALLCLNWFTGGISFYAFSLYAGRIGSNIFFTVAMSGVVVIPGTILCVLLINKCGRRWSIVIANVLIGSCFLVLLLVPLGLFPYDWPRLAATGVGVLGMAISMPSLYLFSGELYPTVVRNAGVGLCVMFSRVGSMVAPLVISLNSIGTWIPLAVLIVLAVAEALLVLPLPETQGIPLPETIADLESDVLRAPSKIRGMGLSAYEESRG